MKKKEPKVKVELTLTQKEMGILRELAYTFDMPIEDYILDCLFYEPLNPYCLGITMNKIAKLQAQGVFDD